MKTTSLVRLILLLAAMAGLLLGLQAPLPAQGATRVKGKVDVCVMKADFPKSWTRGIEKAANKKFKQKVDVRRIAEDRFGGCDAVVWWSGERRAFDHVIGIYSPSGPNYHVLAGTPNNIFKIEINYGSDGIRGKSGRVTLVWALTEAGVR